MKASNLNDMAVVSLQEGTKLGRVEQPLFDLAARQLGGFKVKGDSGTFLLRFTQIDHIGPDVITVSSSEVTQMPGTGGATEGLLGLQALGKLKIVDQEGTFLGTLSDIDVDLVSGEITRLGAHNGGVFGMGGRTTQIESTAIVKVGAELLTVTTDSVTSVPVAPEAATEVRVVAKDGRAASERWDDDGGASPTVDSKGHSGLSHGESASAFNPR